MKGKSTFVTTPLNLCEKRISLLHRMVKIKSNPPPSIKKTSVASPMVKRSGRRGCIFFNPTRGTYQRRKIRKKRIKQVRTNNPIKILFLGLFSKKISFAECQNPKFKRKRCS